MAVIIIAFALRGGRQRDAGACRRDDHVGAALACQTDILPVSVPGVQVQLQWVTLHCRADRDRHHTLRRNHRAGHERDVDCAGPGFCIRGVGH
ncbi:hypothetical protein EA629_25565 [Salmonella enterica]|nr:hypothetical protein [Salmonella enterica subsp. enterica serovar Infantis]